MNRIGKKGLYRGRVSAFPKTALVYNLKHEFYDAGNCLRRFVTTAYRASLNRSRWLNTHSIAQLAGWVAGGLDREIRSIPLDGTWRDGGVVNVHCLHSPMFKRKKVAEYRSQPHLEPLKRLGLEFAGGGAWVSRADDEVDDAVLTTDNRQPGTIARWRGGE